MALMANKRDIPWLPEKEELAPTARKMEGTTWWHSAAEKMIYIPWLPLKEELAPTAKKWRGPLGGTPRPKKGDIPWLPVKEELAPTAKIECTITKKRRISHGCHKKRNLLPHPEKPICERNGSVY